jgi:ectoine hydroxylase-related dioxygenase (phytanoyl-CoA dioxygenase family)
MIPAGAAERFAEDGFVVVERILEPEQTTKVLGAMERVYRGEYNADRRPPRVQKPVAPFGSADSVHWILNARVLDADLWAIATDARLGRMAAELLGTASVSIVEDQLLAKPGPGLPVNLHQDYSYWPFSRSPELITCWVALVDMDLTMGPVEVVRGSHRWGAAPRPKELIRGSEDDWFAGIETIRPPDADLDLVPVVVPAGGGVFFHALTFHGSRGNRTSAWRRAFSLHWSGAACRVDLAQVMHHDYPYFFARLSNGGPIVNQYMPQVYPPP